jgi:hypothetical protein
MKSSDRAMEVQHSENVRTTVTLPIGVHRQARQNALDARRSLSNYLSGILMDCIGDDAPGLRRTPASEVR